MWKIGTVSIDNPFVAAPLAGISNPVWREICHEYGAGLVVSEMISDKALHYESQRTFDMCAVSEKEHPVSLQLFGSDPVTMAEGAEYLTAHTTCDIIDINMGCPVNKVIKAHSGSWLLQHPELAEEIARSVVTHTDKPVTVKIRAGWDHQHINCAEVAYRLEKAGVAAIAIHGRTRSQMYTGNSNNEYIKAVKDAVSIPVIGNGDIRSVEDYHRMMEETGCDAVMIGRGMLGRPFFMKELICDYQNEAYQEPTPIERMQLCEDYAVRLCAYFGEIPAMKMMRSMAAWFLKGLPSSASVRNQLSYMNSLDDLRQILRAYQAENYEN